VSHSSKSYQSGGMGSLRWLKELGLSLALVLVTRHGGATSWEAAIWHPTHGKPVNSSLLASSILLLTDTAGRIHWQLLVYNNVTVR
jgi:hypothetical protein